VYVRAAVLVKVPPAARSFWRQALFSRSLSCRPSSWAASCGWRLVSNLAGGVRGNVSPDGRRSFSLPKGQGTPAARP
jgi:hypothetical protein